MKIKLKWKNGSDEYDSSLTHEEIDEAADEIISYFEDDDELEQSFILDGKSVIIAHRVFDSIIIMDCEVKRVAFVDNLEFYNNEDVIIIDDHKPPERKLKLVK